MINAKAFHASLSEVLGHGVDLAIVLTLEGEVLGSAAAVPESDEALQNNRQLSAVVTNAWRAYASNDLTNNQRQSLEGQGESDSLEALYIEVGLHKLCIVSVSGCAILCLAGQHVEFGMLKLKAGALQQHLDKPLKTVMRHAVRP